MTTDSASAHHFHVTADLCPQALLRILGLAAQNSLIPRSVTCERHDDRLEISLSVDSLSPERAEILLHKLSAIVTVREVHVTFSVGM